MGNRIGVVLVIAGLAGCGGSSNSSKPAPNVELSCNYATDGECDWVSGPQAALDIIGITAASCTAGGGVLVSACPSVRVGRCTITATSGTTTVTVIASYYAPQYDQAAVVTTCNGYGGVFSPRLAPPGSAWELVPNEPDGAE